MLDLDDPSPEDRLHLGHPGECLQGKDMTRLGWSRVGIQGQRDLEEGVAVSLAEWAGVVGD